MPEPPRAHICTTEAQNHGTPETPVCMPAFTTAADRSPRPADRGAAQTQSTTTIQGLLNDDHAKPSARPPVNIFFDKTFGGYVFQDPTAACNPLVCLSSRVAPVLSVQGANKLAVPI